MNFNKEKTLDTLMTVAKFVSFISLVMSIVIKTRVLLGLKNPSEEWKKTSDEDKDNNNDDKSE